MLSISPSYTNNLGAITKLASNPIKKVSLSFKGNTEGLQQDAFVRSTDVQKALSKESKAQYGKKLEKLGYDAFSEGNYRACIESLEKALTINPESARAWHSKASAEKELGLYEEAIQDYTRALALNPNSHKSLGLRGLTKARYAQSIKKDSPQNAKDLYESAVIDYTKSLGIRPSADFYDLKADALMALSKRKEAIEALNQSIILNEAALEKYPDNISVKIKLGNAHHKKGKCLRAIAPSSISNINLQSRDEFTKALEYIPNSANTYFERAKTNKRINSDDAKADIQKAIELAPERGHYLEFYGNMLIMSDDPKEREMGFNYLANGILLRHEQEQ